MATRGTIAVQHIDGTVSVSYSHWDNYLSYNGILLRDHYNSFELAEELVSFGALSILNPLIHPTGDSHSFDNPEDGVTVFYARDRGETGAEPSTYKDFDDYVRNAAKQEFNYIWTEFDDENGNRVEGWLVDTDGTEDNTDLTPLVIALKNDSARN